MTMTVLAFRAALLLLSFKVASALSPPPTKQCVIVGGGPVGYASALTLSSPPHSYNVTVLEKTSGATAVQTYNPTRAFLYNVNPRGLEWIEQYPSVMERLLEKGYSPESGMGTFVNVPAEPDKAIKVTSLRGDMANKTFDQVKRSVWIARHQMVQILKDSCLERAAEGDNDVGCIEICDGKAVTNVREMEDGNGLLVDCEDGTSFPAELVVAADGVDSAVRNCLSQPTSSSSSWLHSKAESFLMKKYITPSTGLRLKALQLPPDFQVPDEQGLHQDTVSTHIYFIESVNKGSDDIRLGLLPSKDPTMIRPGNIVTRPDHQVWSFSDGPSMKKYMQQSFPRFDWDKIVPDAAEWERFAQAKGTSYPAAQYCPGIAVVSPTNPQVGVVLVGDATHAFAPDIGQGINAGLNDVLALDRCMRGQNVVSGESMGEMPKDLATVLTAYEKDRTIEHKALIRLARFGAPYQYRQSWFRDRIGQKFWMANVVLRLLLNKITFGLVPPAAIMQMTETNKINKPVPFRVVMRRADTTTNVLTASFLVGACFWLSKRLL